MESNIKLAIGHAPWWVPVLAANKQQNQSFANALKDFLQNVSFHCYNKLVEKGRTFQERIMWLLFHSVALGILIAFLWNTQDNDDERLTTTIYDPLYAIKNVPFPAVSICSTNRISNVSATQYATELNAKDPLKRDVNYFYEQIQMMSYHYLSQDKPYDYENALKFQGFLDIHDREDAELFYNTARRMQMLTPNCSDLLMQCRLGGKEQNCANLFSESLTAYGYCCTFNFNGQYSGVRSLRNGLVGNEAGLVVLLNASKSDNFFQMFALNGFNTYIYAPNGYPDTSSGAVEERLLQIGVDTFLPVRSKIFETVNEARYLLPKKRNCLFEDEMPHFFGKRYTFSKCITRCRIRSMLILCQCLLFSNPYEYLEVATDTVYCTLQHAECLKRYDFKWLNVITHRENVRGLEREMEEALYCPHCLPSCTEIRYKVTALGLPLNSNMIRTFPNNIDPNSKDLAMVRVYFAETNVPYFRRILKNSWFEVLSTIGNFCGCIAGFSLIGICEWLFFVMQQFLTAYRNEVTSERSTRKNNSIKEELIILP